MTLIVLVTFGLTIAIVVGLYWTFVERPDVVREQKLQKRLEPRGGAFVQQVLVVPEKSFSALNWLDRVLIRLTRLVDPLHRLIERAALRITVGAVVLMSALLAAVAGLVTGYLVRVPGIPYVVGVAAAFVPTLVIQHIANNRLLAFEAQFPAAVDLMARSLRAGHALSTALELVGKEMSDPTGTEFRLLFERHNYGMSLDDALRGFAARVPLLDARFFATAVLTQREVGGNLAEVLENLSSVMRERFKVQREIRVASAHGRITGWVLGLLSPVLAVILSFISPALMTELVRDPIGVRLIVAAILLQITGIFFIRRIVNVEY